MGEEIPLWVNAMPALKKFETFNRKISSAIEVVGVIGLLAIVLITTVDVIGAKIFLHPIFGALDIITQAQLISMTFAAASTLIIGRHIAVELFVSRLPKRVQMVVGLFVNLLGLGLFVLLTWRLTEHAHYLQTANEVSSTARIPLHPFAYCAALACVPVCLVYLFYLIKSIIEAGEVKR